MKPKSRFHIQRPLIGLTLAVTLVVSHLPHAHAADGNWTGSGFDNVWSNDANWSGGVIANGVDATAVLSDEAVSLDSPRTVGNIRFGSDSGSYGGLSPNNLENILTLAVTTGSPIIKVTGQAELTAIIAGTSGFTKTGGGVLFLSQTNSYTGTTTVKDGTLVVAQDGALGNGSNLTLDAETPLAYGGTLQILYNSTQTVGTVTINGTGDKVIGGNLIGTSYSVNNSGVGFYGNTGVGSTISAGLGGSGANFIKSGEGATVLSGANTYGGSTSIGQGTLQFAKSASLYNGDQAKWTSTKLSVASGATLALNVGGTDEFTAAQGKTLLGNLTTSINNNGLKAGSSFGIDTTNAPGDTIFDQVITNSTGTGSGALGITKLGDGKLVLNQANTYTGATTISGGTLAISGGGTLGTNAALNVNAEIGGLDLGGTTQVVGAVTLNQGTIANGHLVGTLYSVPGNDYGGNTSISAGLGGGGVNLNVSGGVILSGANTYTGTTTINGGSITLSGAGTLGDHAALAVNGGNLNLGGTTQTVGAVSIGIGEFGSSVENGTLVSTSYSVSNTEAVIPYPNNISAGLGGVGANLDKSGAGRVRLSGTNSYTGTTTISAGTLQFKQPASLYNGDESKWTKTNISVAAGGTLDVSVGEGGPISPAGFSIAQAKTLLAGLSNSVNNNGLKAGSAFGINLGIYSNDQIFDQVISDSTGTGGGALGFTNQGYAKLTLNQANTYTGPTTVGGYLAISGSGTLGNHADLIMDGASQLDLGGTTQTVGAVSMANGWVRNGNLIATSYAADSASISAGLGGTGASFSKSGEFSVILSGTNTYTGTTTVNGGTLYLEKSASLYNSDTTKWTKTNISVAGGATLAVNIGGTGGFSVAQTKILLGNLTTSINNNGLRAGSTFAIDSNNAVGDTTFDQVIADSTGTGGGALGFTKDGGGKLILTQANTYSGPTTIAGGTLAISGAGKLGSNSALVVGAYGALDLGGTTQSVGSASIMGGVSNGNLVATAYNIDVNATNGAYGNTMTTISAGLGGVGANVSISGNGNGSLTLSGVNTYTGTTSVAPGYGDSTTLQIAKTASLYNGDTAKWTKTNISFGSGATLAVNVGGVGEFSVAQTKTLLSNLTTSVNNNGLQQGSTFAIDTSNASGNTTFNQVIANSTGTSGAGQLNFTKLGTNKLILDQTNTYTGTTTVSSGTLVVNGNISTSFLTTVNNTATLAGSGTVGALTIEVGGTVAPGNSPGILATGDLTLVGTFAAEINGITVGTLYDQLNVTGSVTLSGALALTTSGFTPANENLFFLINNDWNDSVNGTFTDLAEGSEFTLAGQLWSISYHADFDTNTFNGGNDVALMAIPEPSAVLLSGLGLLALLRRRRA